MMNLPKMTKMPTHEIDGFFPEHTKFVITPEEGCLLAVGSDGVDICLSVVDVQRQSTRRLPVVQHTAKHLKVQSRTCFAAVSIRGGVRVLIIGGTSEALSTITDEAGTFAEQLGRPRVRIAQHSLATYSL